MNGNSNRNNPLRTFATRYRQSLDCLLLSAVCLLLLASPDAARAAGSYPSAPSPVAPSAGRIKAGFARVSITPELPAWMTGYAARQKPATGSVHDLWAKALALEDETGGRIVIVTLDILGLSHEIAEEVTHRVDTLYGIKPDQLIMNSSHTHSGPMIWPCLDIIYELSPEDQRRASLYGQQLTDNLVKLIGSAIGKLHPALVSSGHGEAGFAINRRNAIHPDGPIDHDLPVVRVGTPEGKLEVVLFGYACHNTTVVDDNLLFNGDYAGFAQLAVEQQNPGAMAMFMLGCGGDQNPEPRGTLDLARLHGRELAAAVQKVLEGALHPVTAPIRTSAVNIDLAFPPFDPEIYRKDIVGTNVYKQRRAKLMLEAYNKGWKTTSFAYPIKAVRFNKDLTLLALSDEIVVDYALRTKKEYPGENLFVAGYSNEVLCYIPSARILAEGGYEPDESMIYYAFPGPFKTDVEERVFRGIREVMKKAGAPSQHK